MQVQQSDNHLQGVYADDGCSDLIRTDLFHAGARRFLRELCPGKTNAQTYEIAMINQARVSQTFLFCDPFYKTFFMRPLMESLLDDNDTCKRLITNLKRHFCLWRNYKMHTIQESNYRVIKLPCNSSSKVKKINIHFSLQKFQVQPMGWMHLIIFIQIIHLSTDTRQCRTKEILNIFLKGSVFRLHDYQF